MSVSLVLVEQAKAKAAKAEAAKAEAAAKVKRALH